VTRRVAISGAAGFLGRYLCNYLQSHGFLVRALVRDPALSVALLPGIDVRRCELPDGVEPGILSGCDVLIHAAYATKETDPEKMRRVNEDGTRRLFEAARAAHVQRIVFVSSIAADPAAPNYYARSKAAGEALLDARRDLIVRPGLILGREGHGLFQQMRDLMRKLHVVPLFDGGRQPLQTVHVDDLCHGIAAALDQDLTGAVNIAEANPLTLGQFLRALAARLGIRCVFLPLPFGPVLFAVRKLERLGMPVPLRSESLLGMKALRSVPVGADLERLGISARSATESLDTIV
jgi:nucleoside-diphosphate-sugar epimerase